MNLDLVTVEMLSIPFGIVIGPATIVSNIYKAVCDIAKIIFYNYKTHGHIPSNELKDWIAKADLWLNDKNSTDPRKAEAIEELFEDSKKFSPIEQDILFLDSAKYQLARHVSFIGIGLIRTIPVFGGVFRLVREIIDINNSRRIILATVLADRSLTKNPPGKGNLP